MLLRPVLVALAVLTLILAGCGGDDQPAARSSEQAADAAPAMADHGAADHGASAAGLAGAVLQTMEAGGYTYAEIEGADGTFWAAGPVTELAAGDEVVVDAGMAMKGFHSESLDRTFEVIYFTGGFGGQDAPAHASGGQSMPAGMMGQKGNMGHGADMPAGHPPVDEGAELDLSGIAPAEGGKTVAQVWAEHQDLDGQQVTVRGRVVKASANIMGKNWLHLRDGTGAEGTNDLTITSDGYASVGDLVTITGTVTTDRDFGMGYQYDVLIEQAEIVKE
jgi:hypothetical protein